MFNLAFFGTDEYSAIVLDKLLHTGVGITAVITTPPKTEKKTGLAVSNPIENLAKTHSLNIFYYPFNIDDLSKFIKQDTIGISASFGRILTAEVLGLFRHGIYNLHPSLLPKYRNVAPVPYAIAMGDQITGISIFRMDEKIDNGQMVAQVKEPILDTDTTPILLDRLFSLASDLLVSWLSGSPISPSTPISDPLIFTRKLTRQSGFIEWSLFEKYLAKKSLTLNDTKNPLITLRLTHFPKRNNAAAVINDLHRALAGYEKLWTITPSGKEVYITSLTPLMLHLPGKPKPISYPEFVKYYL